jgi:hypothetical protein
MGKIVKHDRKDDKQHKFVVRFLYLPWHAVLHMLCLKGCNQHIYAEKSPESFEEPYIIYFSSSIILQLVRSHVGVCHSLMILTVGDF